MSTSGKRIIKSLKQAVSIADKEIPESHYRVNLPAKIDVRLIRKKMNMTQIDFAKAFGLSLSALRNWEQKRQTPDASTRAYLKVITKEPDMVRKALNDN